MFIEAIPLAQSEQATAVGGSAAVIEIPCGRQLKGLTSSHQGGRFALVAATSMAISTPDTFARGSESTNESTSRSLPAFVSHANSLFAAPPSS